MLSSSMKLGNNPWRISLKNFNPSTTSFACYIRFFHGYSLHQYNNNNNNNIVGPSGKMMTRTTFGSNGIRHFSSSLLLSSKKLAFVGLGQMGLPMCLNLFNKKKNNDNNDDDESLIVYDINPNATQNFLNELSNKQQKEQQKQNVKVASSLDEIIETQPDIIFLSLPNDEIVTNVMTPLIDGMKKNHMENNNDHHPRVFLDTSTISPSIPQSLSQLMKTNNGDDDGNSTKSTRPMILFDAPVSGGVVGAQNGTLTFMVGGYDDNHNDNNNNDDESMSITIDAFNIVSPYLQRMGKSIVPCGKKSGSGCIMKLCNNLALAVQMLGVCEAMSLGQALHVDPIRLAQVINVSTGKSFSSEKNNPHPKVASIITDPPSPASRQYRGGFVTNLMLKDLTLAIRAGDNERVALPGGVLVKELYKLTSSAGMGDRDFSVLFQYLQNHGSSNSDLFSEEEKEEQSK